MRQIEALLFIILSLFMAVIAVYVANNQTSISFSVITWFSIFTLILSVTNYYIVFWSEIYKKSSFKKYKAFFVSCISAIVITLVIYISSIYEPSVFKYIKLFSKKGGFLAINSGLLLAEVAINSLKSQIKKDQEIYKYKENDLNRKIEYGENEIKLEKELYETKKELYYEKSKNRGKSNNG
ncbi:MAG: hypothetical protein LKI22_00190 [Liquorilactobacillus nagelii]|uniref:hypothetical protein n=1 Tax=Liquorilactobacillus nagelii TaxID=82688 RepID=UPI00242CBA4B|nr:hypothetical protein [Liquorilactobacillus nagelii]MCI1632383.1 hypothetical protein [Liquorilactobacillus nagelii]